MALIRNGFDGLLAWADERLERLGGRRGSLVPTAVFLLLPALAILGAFGVLPLFSSVYISLFRDGAFVAQGNYAEALSDERLRDSFLVTIYYAAGTIPATLALSFVVASALFRIRRGRGFFRTLYFLPYVTSVVAAATVWKEILNPQHGLINTALGWTTPGASPWSQWLLEPRGVLHLVTGGVVAAGAGPSLALCCLILFEIWHSSGFMIVILLAGMAAIPPELEEAALIDGANWLQRTRRITIPLLSPTIFFLIIVSGIKAFQAFNSFYALTGNGRGPLDTTQNMTVYIFANMYEYNDYGYGATVAALLCVAIVVLTVVQWRFVGRKVHYD
jgi:multiple sugar transport system permease protein